MTQHDSDEPSVKIVDKRRFSAEGEAKEGEEDKAEEKQATEEARPNANESVERDEHPEVTFSAFIMSLATQVLSMLGEIPSPETNQLNVNLDAARQSIDILSLLQDKTTGNRTPEEDRLMEEVVPSLKMAFVRKVDELKKT
jgi:hypothetical protein